MLECVSLSCVVIMTCLFNGNSVSFTLITPLSTAMESHRVSKTICCILLKLGVSHMAACVTIYDQTTLE